MASNSGENFKIHGLTAAESLTAKQYHVVVLASTARQVKAASSGTVQNLGILDNDPAAGEPASVIGAGMAKAYAGGNITAGALVTANSTAQCVATTTANNKVVGRAITGASSGQLFEVFVLPSNY